MQTSATYLLTDSRQVNFPQKSIFFAIRGSRHNGHQFLPELYKAGVREFVVEQAALTPALDREIKTWPDAKIHTVENSLKALQDLAAQHRREFSIPVVGITGSNGKTIVKEWLTQLLSYDEVVVSSPKSYNSQIGVPLSIWNINAAHTIGVFEAGISQPQEMQYLQPIISPSVGIFTNIGPAHNEGFKSLKQKVTEKLKLFAKAKKVIFRADYTIIQEEVDLILRPVNPGLTTITWAIGKDADYRVTFHPGSRTTRIKIAGKLGTNDFETTFRDDASLENLVHCIVFLLDFGTESRLIQERILRLQPVSMRLELKEGIGGSAIIDDTYNNDLQGLTMALAFLARQDQKKRKVVILSDVLQSGLDPAELYKTISNLLMGQGVDQLIGIGPEISRRSELIDLPLTQFYPTTEAFMEAFQAADFASSLILVKGARPFAFEKIVTRLQQRVHGTVFEVNLDALTNNLNFYKSKVKQGTKIMAMVKAFAYGSGSAEVANLLQFHKVDYLGVAYADEGVALRQNGIRLPIMVMNPSEPSFDTLIQFDLQPELYSRKILTEWVQFCKNYSSPMQIPAVHIKLDTGMHRLGFLEEEYEWLTTALTTERKFLHVASIFSHLVGADEGIHNVFSHLQYQRFVSGAAQLEQAIGRSVIKHMLNSAGIIRFPEYCQDMVRLGIGLYGVDATGEEQGALQAVGRLKTIISQVKNVPKGESIGYSRKGVLERDSMIGTLAIGYADGFDRRLGNGIGRVWVLDQGGFGQFCPTVGNVCMDMTMVDLSGTNAREGDEVTVFGPENPVSVVAEKIGTIPYELLTGISQRVKRVFYKE